MARSLPLFIVALMLFASSSRAHAAETKPGLDITTQPAGQMVSAPEEKSPMVARLYAWLPTLTLTIAGAAVIDAGGGLGAATWTTVGGYGLMTLGMGVAPSGGQIYAGESGRLVLRTVLCGVTLLFWQLASESGNKEFVVHEAGEPSSGNENDFGTIFLMGGLALAGTIWTATLAIKDLWDAPDAARRANRKAATLNLAPVVLRSEGTTHLGLGLAGRF